MRGNHNRSHKSYLILYKRNFFHIAILYKTSIESFTFLLLFFKNKRKKLIIIGGTLLLINNYYMINLIISYYDFYAVLH